MPRSSAKIAISLDAGLLESVGRVQRTTGETRSAVLARAVRLLVREEERRVQIDEYLAAYRRVPESSAEVDEARSLAKRSFAHVVWDDE